MLIGKAHRLWIDFLKLVPVEKWSEQVQKDFEGADRMSTEDFLQARFNPLFDETLGDLCAYAEAVVEVHPGDTWDQSNHLALVIELGHPHADVMALVEEKLRIARKELTSIGRPKFRPPRCDYPFCAPPDVNALEITLHIHNLRKKDLKDLEDLKIEKTKPLWELMVETQKEFPIMSKQKLHKGDAPKKQVSQKKALSVVASRYLERAERIKAGVANGIFPAP